MQALKDLIPESHKKWLDHIRKEKVRVILQWLRWLRPTVGFSPLQKKKDDEKKNRRREQLDSSKAAEAALAQRTTASRAYLAKRYPPFRRVCRPLSRPLAHAGLFVVACLRTRTTRTRRRTP